MTSGKGRRVGALDQEGASRREAGEGEGSIGRTECEKLDQVCEVDRLAIRADLFELLQEHFDGCVDVWFQALHGFHGVCLADKAALLPVNVLIALSSQIEGTLALEGDVHFAFGEFLSSTCVDIQKCLYVSSKTGGNKWGYLL